MTNWKETMMTAANDRQAKYETVLCATFDLSRIPKGEAVIVGAFSCTWMHAKRRYIKRQYAVNVGLGIQTPGEVARDYLLAKFGRATPAPKSRYPDATEFLAMPAYAEPGKLKGDHVYIDVDGAYWTVLSIAGWSCAYAPGRFLMRGGSVADFPLKGHKLARNMLVTFGLPAKLYMLTHYGPVVKKTYNRLLNGHLWRLASDCLHALAAYAVDECGARYFLTDGAIMPERYVDRYRDFAFSMGFTTSYKSDVGPGFIKSVGAYKLPGLTTKTFARYSDRPHFRIREVDDLLVDRMRWLKGLNLWPETDDLV
jgi:hypothetical protein